MKVLSAIYGTQLFGRERENLECFKALIALGYEVDVFCSYREEDGGAVGHELSKLGIHRGLLPFGSHFSLKYFLSIRGYWHRQVYRVWKCSQLMRAIDKKERPSFILIGGTMEFLYLWPWLVRTRTPIIFRVEDSPEWNSKFHLNIYRWLLGKSTLVLACSEYIKGQCEQLLPIKRHKDIIHLPNCAPAFTGGVFTSNEIHTKMSGLKLLYVGQITKQKGLVELVEAMDALQNEHVELIVVGGSEFTSEFESELKERCSNLHLRVTWAGRVSDPTPYYEWADVHVAPSVYEEPFGLVVVEAKRSSVPSIVFPSGGMKELVEDGVDGWVCSEKSVDSLVHSIRNAINRRFELSKMGALAFANFEEQYAFGKFTENWKEALQKLNQ